MFALYAPGRSPVHRLSAGLKLGFLFVFGLAVAFAQGVLPLGLLLAGVLALYALAGLSLKFLWRALAPAFFAIALFALLQVAFAGWQAGLATVLRTISLVLGASLVTFTTPFAGMIDALTFAARPLSRLGVPPARTGLALALAIRFIPVLMKDYRDIQDARIARGGSRFGVMALGPLLIKTLRMSTELGEAITARGFENRDGGMTHGDGKP
jgi:biotin transport system permease protein